MTPEKQIGEMAEVLGGTCVVDLEGNPHDLSEVLWQCDIDTIAKQLYEADYRKASEVAKEIFAELKTVMIDEWRYPIIAELKKKYLEGEV